MYSSPPSLSERFYVPFTYILIINKMFCITRELPLQTPYNENRNLFRAMSYISIDCVAFFLIVLI
jgi:hypothetical protein